MVKKLIRVVVVFTCFILVSTAVACGSENAAPKTETMPEATLEQIEQTPEPEYTRITTEPEQPTEKALELEAVTGYFTDAKLEAAIMNALGKDVHDEVTPAEFANLAELSCVNMGIRELSGLEYCTGLTKLALQFNQIKDISPLKNLTGLTSLQLNHNQLSDISPLASLINLTALYLDNNEIADISPLSGLTNLIVLNLERNRVSEITSLLENSGLGEGCRLFIESNDLGVWENSDDLAEIEELMARGVDVSFEYTKPEIEASGIFADYNLEVEVWIDLGKKEGEKITESELVGLSKLSVVDEDISDISGLEYCAGLNVLSINGTKISDLSPLANLVGLRELELSDNQITDISALSGLTGLTKLNICKNEIEDLSPLSGMINLEIFYALSNNIRDISILANMNKLTELGLSIII